MKTKKYGITAIGQFRISAIIMVLLTLSIVNARIAKADTTNHIAVYSVANKSDHYLTTDENRANYLVKFSGYNSKTLVGYLPTSGTKIHNWYSSKSGHYLTTDDTTKNQNRLKALGYKQMDGTTNLYSAKNTDSGAVPMYIWFNRQGNHYYNIDKNHIFRPAVYNNRSVAWYGFNESNTVHTPVHTIKYILDGVERDTEPIGSGYSLILSDDSEKSEDKSTFGDYTTTLYYHKISRYTIEISYDVNENGEEIVPTDQMVKVGAPTQKIEEEIIPLLGDTIRTITTTQVWHLITAN